jgi:hypothetical protein
MEENPWSTRGGKIDAMGSVSEIGSILETGSVPRSVLFQSSVLFPRITRWDYGNIRRVSGLDIKRAIRFSGYPEAERT